MKYGLIVIPDRSLRQAIEEYLSDRGLEVVTYASASAAAPRRADGGAYDVAVLFVGFGAEWDDPRARGLALRLRKSGARTIGVCAGPDNPAAQDLDVLLRQMDPDRLGAALLGPLSAR